MEMPRDMGLACKKRLHPDGLHLSSSLPKRLLSVSEAEIGYSVEDASISPGTAMNTTHGSLCNSASSALINSTCSTSIHPGHSSMSLDAASSKLEGPGFVYSLQPSDAASSKLEGPGFVLSRLPSDGASSKHEGANQMPSNVTSYNLGALNSTRDSLRQGNGKGIWTYGSASTKHEGLDCEGELSEVTCEKHAQTLFSGSEKATHVISRRDVSSLNSKDELWHTAAPWEGGTKLYGARQRRDYNFSSMACESASSCATGDSIRPKHAFPPMSVCKESSTTPSHTHTRAEVLVEPRLQESIGFKDDNIVERRPSSEVVLCPSSAIEEIRPSYVLSSGRMSLEEEAKLGRRAPTIDQDFEEYFSSLML